MRRKEFDEWLYQNLDRLREYEGWEVARLALACGFQMADIAPDLSVWDRVSRNKKALLSNPLMLQWVHLWSYERGREWRSY